MPKPTRQLLRSLVRRGLASTEYEGLAFLRALKAIDHGRSPWSDLGLANHSPEHRARIVENAIAWRAR